MNATQASENATVFAIDPVHSHIDFTVRHLMISKVRGRFGTFEGTIALQAGSDLPSAIDVKIDASSVDTREPQRDGHLASEDFLDVEQFPTIAFTSNRTEGTPDDFRVHGSLTIHGVTKDVVLNGEFEGRGADPWGGQRIGYSAKTAINRKDFGLVWNQSLETGGVVVGDEIKIELNVEAVKKS